MRLQDVIPYMVCVNLAAREDRRRAAWGRFAAAGLLVDRQPGVLKRTVTDPRGFKSAARYACSLAKRLAIRRAKLAGAPAVLLFEDDVVLAPDLHERLAEIELPEDWGIFFLGCKHLNRPAVVAPGLVRVAKAADHHAIAIRREYYDAMIWALAGGGKGCSRIIDYSDVKSSEMNAVIPSYACFPNLAWQAWSHSDNSGHALSHYSKAGRQTCHTHAVSGLEEEMTAMWQLGGVDTGLSASEPGAIVDGSAPSPGHTLVTSPDPGSRVEVGSAEPSAEVSRNDGPMSRPDFSWIRGQTSRHRLEATFPLRFYLNLGRREDRRFELEYQFALHDLELERFPAVDARFSRSARGHEGKPQRACALSHRLALREARRRGAPTVLILEDDATPHPDFRQIAEALEPPADWGVLFLGCTHVEPPQVVSPGWVRVSFAYAMHAYAVKACWYDRVIDALGKAGPNGRRPGCDVALTRLSREIPMYACYPNLVWQARGFSDLRQRGRAPFADDGRQTVHPEALTRADAAMVKLTGGPLREKDSWLKVEDVHAPNREGGLRLESTFPLRVFLNLEGRVDRREQAAAEFFRHDLGVERVAAVDGRRAKRRHGYSKPGEYGCAVSHRIALREGEGRGAGPMIIFEDDVVLHPRFREIVESTKFPDDWEILYFGCAHIQAPHPTGRGLVRVGGAFGSFAYAVRDPRVMRIIRKTARERGKRRGEPYDVVLSGLACSLATYAFYPNIAWPRSGHSDITGREVTSSYDGDGRQCWPRNKGLIQDLDRRMRMVMELEGRP